MSWSKPPAGDGMASMTGVAYCPVCEHDRGLHLVTICADCLNPEEYCLACWELCGDTCGAEEDA